MIHWYRAVSGSLVAWIEASTLAEAQRKAPAGATAHYHSPVAYRRSSRDDVHRSTIADVVRLLTAPRAAVRASVEALDRAENASRAESTSSLLK